MKKKIIADKVEKITLFKKPFKQRKVARDGAWRHAKKFESLKYDKIRLKKYGSNLV